MFSHYTLIYFLILQIADVINLLSISSVVSWALSVVFGLKTASGRMLLCTCHLQMEWRVAWYQLDCMLMLKTSASLSLALGCWFIRNLEIYSKCIFYSSRNSPLKLWEQSKGQYWIPHHRISISNFFFSDRFFYYSPNNA